MAITPLAPLDRTSPTFRTDVDNFFGSAIPAFVGQANALAANLNSIAAGGAYAIPYKLGVGSDVGYGNGFFALNGSALSSTEMYVDNTDLRGINLANVLYSTTEGNTSSVKGHIRLTVINRPTAWALFRVTALLSITDPARPYKVFSIAPIDASEPFPFSAGEAVEVSFQRTGDKGDAGSLTTVLWVRDVKGSGQSAGTTANTQRRTLNTVKRNTIPGASLSGDVITVPPGTYRLSASAPAYSSGRHRAYASITVGGVTTSIEGQTANGSAPSAIQMSEFLAGSTASISIQHMFDTWNVPNGLGLALGLGGEEVYTDVFIEKVS
ncbi:hypothetical protein [Massilia sp. UBA6681]|uniref:hypothetical protein n=1 Tax=Massilia sp. UBA6681 TaxID=1946839 RepID=UPI0025C3E1C6|nr:hypothetical protein [Massilia sp. UBA6681]